MRPALEQAALPIATLVDGTDASKRGQLQMLVTKMHAILAYDCSQSDAHSVRRSGLCECDCLQAQHRRFIPGPSIFIT